MAAVNGGSSGSSGGLTSFSTSLVSTTIGSLFSGGGIESPFITTSVNGNGGAISAIGSGMSGAISAIGTANSQIAVDSSSPIGTGPASPSGPFCQGCKSKEHSAVARCHDCSHFLCPNCVMAHQFMHCFEGHRVVALNNDGTAVSTSALSNGGLDESLLNSVVASVDRQLIGGSSSPPFSNNHSSPNGSVGSHSSSGCLDPTQLVHSNIQSETSLAPGGPVAGKVNGFSPHSPHSINEPLNGKVFNCPKHKGEGKLFDTFFF